MLTPNHPFNITYLINTLSAQLAPQPGHDKARSDFDEDERSDGRPKTQSIQVLVVRPNEIPELVTIKNELSAMQNLVGGTITCFDTGHDVEGTIGVANDEAVLLQMPPNRFIKSSEQLVFGPFFVAGDGVNFHSLAEQELVASLKAFVPPLTLEQVQIALRASKDSEDWIEREMDEALDD